MRRGWRVAPDPELRDTADRDLSLTYLAADRSFALLTDLEAHVTQVVRDPPVDRLVERFPNAAVGDRVRGPGPYRLPPDESVAGYGTFTFPYGPIDAGVPEAGRFDVRTYGERILELTPIGGYKRRHIAESLRGLRPEEAALRVERIAGTVSAAHASAFWEAVESALGRPVPAVELWTRALAQELQRIWNHLRVVAREAEAASQPVGAAQMQALAEEVLRVQGRIFGHRWLFGALVPGGPPRRLEPDDRRAAGAEIARLSREFDRLWELFSDARIFIDRLQTTCAIDRATAVRWGAVGPTLRASHAAWDDRVHAPRPPYDDLFVAVPQQEEGDALARVMVRVDEIRASAVLLEQILERWPGRDGTVDPAPPIAPGRGVARVEAPSGDLVYDVAVDDGRIRSVAWRSPTEANFPLFATGMRNWVFTDFHFSFESFGLVFAEMDG